MAGRRVACPHCMKSLGGETTEGGGVRLRLGITIVDDNGSVRGPCPACGGEVVVADGATLAKAIVAPDAAAEADNPTGRLPRVVFFPTKPA